MKIIRISAMWCSSCLVTFSKWEEVKKNHPEIEFQELDYDMDDLSKYQVGDVLPMIIIEKNNQEVARIVGEFSVSEVEDVITHEKMDS